MTWQRKETIRTETPRRAIKRLLTISRCYRQIPGFPEKFILTAGADHIYGTTQKAFCHKPAILKKTFYSGQRVAKDNVFQKPQAIRLK